MSISSRGVEASSGGNEACNRTGIGAPASRVGSGWGPSSSSSSSYRIYHIRSQFDWSNARTVCEWSDEGWKIAEEEKKVFIINTNVEILSFLELLRFLFLKKIWKKFRFAQFYNGKLKWSSQILYCNFTKKLISNGTIYPIVLKYCDSKQIKVNKKSGENVEEKNQKWIYKAQVIYEKDLCFYKKEFLFRSDAKINLFVLIIIMFLLLVL